MKKVWIWVISVLTLLIIFFIAYQIIIANVPSIDGPCMFGPDAVKRVIDGDTFELCSGDIVRLLCVDTPEKGQPGYEESSNFLASLIGGREIVLEPSNYEGNNTDKYGRLLRWVYVRNESSETQELVLVNKYLLEEGYGDILIIPPETCNEVSD